MPEGDTLHRIARTLSLALSGERLVSGALTERARGDGLGPAGLGDAASPLVRVHRVDGARVSRVEARGKHLLVHLSTEQTICTHLGVNGSWHLYRVGERWHSRPAGARVSLETRGRIAVCFLAPLVTLVETHRLEVLPALRGLGPDILGDAFDAEAAAARLRRRPELPIGVAIVDQRAVSGIGNIYKSETLFLERVDPFAPVAALDDAILVAILKRARRLMAASLGAARGEGPSSTGRLRGRSARFVYERSGRRCRVCSSPIALRRQGDLGRSTYYCPACQGVDRDSAPGPLHRAPS